MENSNFYKNILLVAFVFAIWYVLSRYICYKNGYFINRFGKKIPCNQQYAKIILLFIIVIIILFYIKYR